MTAAVPDTVLTEAAAASPWAARLITFTQWVGTGRRVTQTGRVTLAQARELIDLLDTGDVIDPMVGDRVCRTKSSEDLPILNMVVEWAKASRLVRVSGGKLVPVAKNAPLLGRPVALWQRMFEVFDKLGPAICPSGWGESLLRYRFADGMTTVLAMLYTAADPIPVADVCAQVWPRVSAGYRLGSVPDAHRDTWRRCNDRDVRRALALLAQFGALHVDGPADAQSVTLTPLGAWAGRSSTELVIAHY